MNNVRLLVLTTLLAACTGGDSDQAPAVDASVMPPVIDAAPPPPPIDARLKLYGETCGSAGECQTGLCIGVSGGQYKCSRYCSINDPNPCKDVDAFCAPYAPGGNVCYGSIETGNDLDDAILSVGDAATRSLTPLTDADLFQVRLNQLGTIQILVTPTPSIDVKLEAYSGIGEAIGIANNNPPGSPEALTTTVQQPDGYVFMVVRNVGTSTGDYTISVAKIMMATGKQDFPRASTAVSEAR